MRTYSYPRKAGRTAFVRRPAAETAFDAIRIEGGLFPAEFLQRIARLDAPGQSPDAYGMPPGRTLRDEIGRYWTIAEALWKEFSRDRKRTDLSAERTAVERWLQRLLREVFGYADLTKATGQTLIGERRFPISHRAHADAVPLLLTLPDRDLDRSDRDFGEDSRRRAPHAAMQEYLNADPVALWGVVSNGLTLRLVRDNPTLTRPAYLEADLERIFEEGLYPDFAALWLTVSATRVAPGPQGMAGCWLESWRTEGTKTGQRALERLRAGVTTALRELGSGFVEHPDNEELRTALRDGRLTAEGVHQQLLRLVYRLLCLFTAEERNLLHSPDAPDDARMLYAHSYSLGRLRDRARQKRHYDRFGDLWTGLTVTVRALMRGAPPLALPALGGLFDPSQCPDLDRASLSNSRLLTALHALAYFTEKAGLQRINYRDMGTEELGSVYESLLELHPVVQVATRPWRFAFVGDDTAIGSAGSERKRSGSYYTPDSLVQELLRSALDPVIERTIRDNLTYPKAALLRLKVLDPACGSGHFLLGAARRLADAVARLDADGDIPDEELRRHALREVVRRCIYGVDRNPLAVELCKAALWIEAIEPGKPMSFLDAHIKCGDSLIGVADLTVLKSGIPDEAFKDLTGDDKTYARELRKRNKAERDNPSLGLVPEIAFPNDLATAIAALSDAPDDTVEDVEAKRQTLAAVTTGAAGWVLKIACDLWCAAFFAPKVIVDRATHYQGRELAPTTDTVWRYLRTPNAAYGPLIAAVDAIAQRLKFFHWPLEFPDVFALGGFDCVLGNPPWEVLQLKEEEYFAARSPTIAALPGTHRREAIKKLETTEPALWASYRADLRLVEANNEFLRGTGLYKLTAHGKLNTYALFAETFIRLLGIRGRAGVILPTGIATDDSNKAFFEEISSKQRLASLYDFENREGLFTEVHRSYKFSLITLGQHEATARFVFFATRIEHLLDKRRAFTLTAEDIRLINPNTRTCPVFRSFIDADLTKRIYSNSPVLIRENNNGDESKFGAVVIQNFFSTSNSVDQKLFVLYSEVNFDDSSMTPVRRGSMIWQFDHRAAALDPRTGNFRELTSNERLQVDATRSDKYVSLQEVKSRLARRGWRQQWMLGWRDICRSTDERTLIATALPCWPTDDTLSILLPTAVNTHQAAILLGCLNSLVVDYVAQQKVGGTHVRKYVIAQLPILVPDRFPKKAFDHMCPLILELTYTADDMQPWAMDLGYNGPPFVWDEDRRAHLRAELDASYAYLYGLTRDELRYVLDPTDVYGPDFPSETFRVLKEKEFRQFGEYRTQRLVLAAWDRFTADGTFAGWT